MPSVRRYRKNRWSGHEKGIEIVPWLTRVRHVENAGGAARRKEGKVQQAREGKRRVQWRQRGVSGGASGSQLSFALTAACSLVGACTARRAARARAALARARDMAPLALSAVFVAAAAAAAALLGGVAGIDNGLGITPPQGWRSWNVYPSAR